MSQTHSDTHGRLAFSTIPPLFVDRFFRFPRFCYLEFDKEAISDGMRRDYVLLIFNDRHPADQKCTQV